MFVLMFQLSSGGETGPTYSSRADLQAASALLRMNDEFGKLTYKHMAFEIQGRSSIPHEHNLLVRTGYDMEMKISLQVDARQLRDEVTAMDRSARTAELLAPFS